MGSLSLLLWMIGPSPWYPMYHCYDGVYHPPIGIPGSLSACTTLYQDVSMLCCCAVMLLSCSSPLGGWGLAPYGIL